MTYIKYLMCFINILVYMLRVSLSYISIVIILSIFFMVMTLKYTNYHNQFNVSNEEIKIILIKNATH
jgi:hypothetical protein